MVKKTFITLLMALIVSCAGSASAYDGAYRPHVDYTPAYSYNCFGGGAACHIVAKNAFLPQNINTNPDNSYTNFCLSCHNATGEAHDRSVGGPSTNTYENITGRILVPGSYKGVSHSWNGVNHTAGTRTPTLSGFKIFSSGSGTDHMPPGPDGDVVTCQVCHQGMGKVRDENLDWNLTTTSDEINYKIHDSDTGLPLASTEQHLAKYIRVMRDTGLIGRPNNSRTKKNYLVDPSEYSYDWSTATVIFAAAQDPGVYIYVDIGQPYMRACNANDMMCLDCHVDRLDLSVSHAPGDGSNDHHPVAVNYGQTNGLHDTLKPAADGNIYIEGGKVFCSSCHDPHNSVSNDGMILRSQTGSELCTDCHAANGFDGYSTKFLANHNGSKHTGPTLCLDCHTTHNTDNILLIRKEINGKTVSFRNFTGADSFGNDTGSSVCEACHTQTTFHKTDGTGTGHNAGKDCTGCHTHANGFGGGGCTGCHGMPPTTAGELVSNPVSTGSATAGAHDMHANTNGYSCGTCHRGGMVSSSDADYVIQVGFSFNGYTSGVYDGQTTLSNGYTYSAPNTSGGSMTCTLVYCHSSGQAEPAFRTTPAWPSATGLDCGGCHGADGHYSLALGAPDYQNISTASRNSFNGHYVSGHVSSTTDCANCHSATVDSSQNLLGTGNHLNGFREVSFALGGSYSNKRCTGTDAGCHGSSTMLWGGTATCIDCHSAAGAETDDYVYGNATKATVSFAEWTSVGHGKKGTYLYTGNSGADKVCEDCHTSSVAHDTATNPFRLTNADTVALCTGCHSAGIGNHDFAHVAQGSWSWTPKCVDCHDPHGDKGGVTSSEYNGAMVQSMVSYTASDTYGVPGTTEAVDFPANYARAKSIGMFNWSSFVVTTGQSNKGVCRVCHTDAGTTYFTRTAFDGTHNNGQSACVSCHSHTEGFRPSCEGCHGYPPSAVDANADNAGAVGAHDTHVNTIGLGCYDCHKGNTHNQMGVMATYTGALNAAFVNMSVSSTHGLHGAKPSYNGVPGSWTPAKTCSNVSCHYGESKAWDCP